MCIYNMEENAESSFIGTFYLTYRVSTVARGSTWKFPASTDTKNSYLKRQACRLGCWVAQLWWFSACDPWASRYFSEDPQEVTKKGHMPFRRILSLRILGSEHHRPASLGVAWKQCELSAACSYQEP